MMPKIRTVKTKNFSLISNDILWDKRLSIKARFMLIFCLSLADGWEYSGHGLASSIGISYDAVVAGLKELEKYRYLHREQLFDDKKRFAGYDYVFYEAGNCPTDEKPLSEKPLTEKPLSEKPLSENQHQLNTKELNTKEIKNQDDEEDNIAVVIDFWNKNIHPITPYEFEELRSLIEDAGVENVQEAMKRSCDANKRGIGYVRTVAMALANGNDFKKVKKAENFDEEMAKIIARWEAEDKANGGNN